MIFLGIIDPDISNANLGVEQHYKWCLDWCQAHGTKLEHLIIQTKEANKEDIDISGNVLQFIKEEITRPENYNKNVYIYFNTHGITESDGEKIELNKKSYISDLEITKLFFENNVGHLTVFFECCHSSGFFQPDEECLIHEDRLVEFIPGYVYSYKGGRNFSIWKGNITVFNTSLKEQKSYQLNKGDKGIGLATFELTELEQNPFEYSPEYVADWLNERVGAEQYATVKGTSLIPKWFN